MAHAAPDGEIGDGGLISGRRSGRAWWKARRSRSRDVRLVTAPFVEAQRKVSGRIDFGARPYRQPVRHEVAMHVLETSRYFSVRSDKGQRGGPRPIAMITMFSL